MTTYFVTVEQHNDKGEWVDIYPIDTPTEEATAQAAMRAAGVNSLPVHKDAGANGSILTSMVFYVERNKHD